MTLVLPKFSANSFLCDVRAYDVDGDSRVRPSDGESPLDVVAVTVAESGKPKVHSGIQVLGDEVVAFGIPVYRDGRVVSVVVVAAKMTNDLLGVFEVWTPVGTYEEVRLTDGYFAGLERFQNVSSFIRFEKGLGLPGQVWETQRSTIHDNLPNHPGFLRSAGASAEDLQVAIGIPVAAEELIGVAVLMSAMSTPMAQGFEVWQSSSEGFRLDQASYSGLSLDLQLTVGTKLSANSGLPGLAAEHGGASTTENETFLYAGRSGNPEGLAGALAIPFYQQDKLTSVTALLF
tara:strand:+ start:480366 stop:481232 length:867 start_codon:yes stop_codon:yes gene_type:complete